MYEFTAISDWINITNSESFQFKDNTYQLSDFVKIHNNPWVSFEGVPDHIHAMHASETHDPIYLELSESGEQVRLYRLQERMIRM